VPQENLIARNYFLLGTTIFAFFGEVEMVMSVLGPANEPSLTSTVAVRSSFEKTKMPTFDLTALIVVQPAFGYSA